MKTKFADPTGNGVIWLTQTNHGETASNPSDLSRQCAIDISMKGNEFFHSVCDGIVELVTTGLGSYISVIPDGQSFRVLYVHTYKFKVKKGDKVKAGQILGQIVPTSGSHLHLGLKNKNGKKPHPCPMDYMPRNIEYKTRYEDIKAEWFKSGKINWNKHKNLYLDISKKEECCDSKKELALTKEALMASSIHLKSLIKEYDILKKSHDELTKKYEEKKSASEEETDVLLAIVEKRKRDRLSQMA